MKSKKVLFVTRTALFIAMTVAVQFFTSMAGQLVTGSLVNMIFILSLITSGRKVSFTIAVVSPFFAKILGIGPQLLPIVPVISIGNLIFVEVYYLVKNKANFKFGIKHLMVIILPALLKFLTMFLSIIYIIVPIFNVPEPMAAMLYANFGIIQFFTAVLGLIIATTVKKAIQK